MASRVKNPPTVQETQEMWVQSLGQEDPLEKGMATHNSLLAWRIPWIEEPCGLLVKQLSTHAGHREPWKPTWGWLGMRDLCLHAQWCLSLCDPMDCSPPGSSVHGILQARILEWVAVSLSRGSSEPGIQPRSPELETFWATSLLFWATKEAHAL